MQLSGRIFYLNENDTRPVLSVTLIDTDNTSFDLTNVDTVYLHITRPDGVKISGKTMTMAGGGDTTGVVTYIWLAADWNATTGLVVGPNIPLTGGAVEAYMNYETVGPTTARLTFPNDGTYDTLRIAADIGTGA